MPLSLNKLEQLLSSKGFIPKKFFIIHGLCVYIEVLSIKSAENFMFYIPSKYEIPINTGDSVYKLKYIEINEDGYIPGDYGGEPDNFELEKSYEEIDINLSPDLKNKNINLADKLEENYNHPLSLKNINKEDTANLREIFRQLRRLKFCVNNLKYKLCIHYKCYLCCIRRDGTFEAYNVSNFSIDEDRKLIVTIDLENLYDKLDSVAIDIKTVREGIYNVLDKNQLKHTTMLKKMLDQKSDPGVFSDSIYKKKTTYSAYLKKLEQLLDQLNKSEKMIVEQLVNTEEKYSNNVSGAKGVQNDIERTHIISKYESEMSTINGTKQEIMRNIFIVRDKLEDLTLKIDKILFDNSIMLNAIIKNLLSLAEICS